MTALKFAAFTAPSEDGAGGILLFAANDDETKSLAETFGAAETHLTNAGRLRGSEVVTWQWFPEGGDGLLRSIHRYHGNVVLIETDSNWTEDRIRNSCRQVIRARERADGAVLNALYAVEDSGLIERQRLMETANFLGNSDASVEEMAVTVLMEADEATFQQLLPEIAASVVRAYTDGSWHVRLSFPAIFPRLRPAAAFLIGILAEKLASDDPRVRQSALEICAGLGPVANELLPQVLALSDDPEEYLRWEAVETIAAFEVGGPEVLLRLARALSDQGEQRMVRAAAAVALARLPEPPMEALQELIVCIGTYDPIEAAGRYSSQSEARRWAAVAIGRIGPSAHEAIPPLLRMLEQDNAFQRIAAAEGLAGIGAEASPFLSRIEPRLDDPDSIVSAMLAAKAKLVDTLSTEDEEPERIEP